MKRYQNPDVFEPLAMAYALGTLQGRARKRFAKLMGRHFYLRVVTEAYEQQFAGLVGLLPEEAPSPAVWQRLENELGLTGTQPVEKAASSLGASWRNWLHWPAMALASVLAAVITVFMLNNPAPQAYFAKLYSSSSTSTMVAMAEASKKDMKITVAMAEKFLLQEGVMPTLWCLSKTPGEKPMRMGVLKPTGQSQVEIDTTIWNGLADVSQLVISLEPIDQPASTEPAGKVIFKGDLLRGE